MKIKSLRISNFRGIVEATLDDLGAVVVIAGQNGSGKSCIFDAIRLIKSAYGGYQPNEWQQWLTEFQIRVKSHDAKPADFISLFNDRTKPLLIECDFELSQSEVDYLHEHKADLLRRISGEESRNSLQPQSSPFAGEDAKLAAEHKEYAQAMEAELQSRVLRASLFINVEETPQIYQSATLRTIFSTYEPQIIGVIDYHGPHRNYAREFVQNVNFDPTAKGQNRGHSALYNYAQKYSNVKSEMAASYIRELIAREAGQEIDTQSTLTITLKELFKSFFPDKEFLGPTASISGTVDFNVRLSNGGVHDIDELSAGEKEIIYGYLRIRNTAPQNSIILLDEPELHLNPKLIRALPHFYRTYLGESSNNQIWLVTHSDALLREVVGVDGYDVFHMLSCTQATTGTSQLKALSVKKDLEVALIDLVGDLATYHPTGKVVIFEGGGDSELDKRTVSGLFPELSANAMLISGTDKAKVKALHSILEKASTEDDIPFKFYSVTDADWDSPDTTSVSAFTWDVYHIENYFLEPNFIRQALQGLHQISYSEEHILQLLKDSAKSISRGLVQNHVSSYANRMLVSKIRTRCDPSSDTFADKIFSAANSSADDIRQLLESDLSLEALALEESTFNQKIEEGLANGDWIRSFPGRLILADFVGKHVKSTKYEWFRNLIFDRMKGEGFRPAGMATVVGKILT